MPPFLMNFSSWNCQDLGRASAVRGLKSLVQNSSSLGLFLIETKVDGAKMTKIAKGLPFDNFTFVEAEQRVGGLAFFWKSETG